MGLSSDTSGDSENEGSTEETGGRQTRRAGVGLEEKEPVQRLIRNGR